MPIIFVCTSLMRLIPSLSVIPHTKPILDLPELFSPSLYHLFFLLLLSMAQQRQRQHQPRINIIQCRRHSINKFLLYTHTHINIKYVSGVKYSKNSCFGIELVFCCDTMRCNAMRAINFLFMHFSCICIFDAKMWQYIAHLTSHNLEY